MFKKKQKNKKTDAQAVSPDSNIERFFTYM